MILHKLRRATVNANRTKLHGRVEIDEVWIGGVQASATGRTRHGRNAALDVLALGVGDGVPGRLRTRLEPDDTADSLVGFAQDVVEVGATVITDGWAGHLALPEPGFIHERITRAGARASSTPCPISTTPSATWKTWLAGTHKRVSRHHLAAYVDEFVFRHNRRRNLAAAFQTFLGRGATRDPTTYATISYARDIPAVTYTLSRQHAGTRMKQDGARFVCRSRRREACGLGAPGRCTRIKVAESGAWGRGRQPRRVGALFEARRRRATSRMR